MQEIFNMEYEASWSNTDSSALICAISSAVSSLEATIRQRNITLPGNTKLSLRVYREETENLPDDVFYFVSVLSIAEKGFGEKRFSLVFPANSTAPFFLFDGVMVTPKKIFGEVIGKALEEYMTLCASQLPLMTER